MTEQPGPVARAALAFTAWTERWVPDAFIFALIATVIVVAAGLIDSGSPAAVVDAWGRGFWDLIRWSSSAATSWPRRARSAG
jgi:short-chain fatty acids transporter